MKWDYIEEYALSTEKDLGAESGEWDDKSIKSFFPFLSDYNDNDHDKLTLFRGADEMISWSNLSFLSFW